MELKNKEAEQGMMFYSFIEMNEYYSSL